MKDVQFVWLISSLFFFAACSGESSISSNDDNGYSSSFIATDGISSNGHGVFSSSSSSFIEESSQDHQGTSSYSSEISSSSIMLVEPSSVVIDSFIDNRDGSIYKMVTIGTQTWMAENLKFEIIPQNDDEIITTRCYKNDPYYCDDLGRLYSWSVAMDSMALFSEDGKGCGFGVVCKSAGQREIRGICPEGWHLPSIAEWQVLGAATGDTPVMLRSTSLMWNSCDRCGSVWVWDGYRFTVHPSGKYFYREGYYSDEYVRLGWNAFFLTSDEENEEKSSYVRIDYDAFHIEYPSYDKRDGGSIRCLKNERNSEPATEEFKAVDPSSVVKGVLTDERDGKQYATVTIGNQTWMAENLEYFDENANPDLDGNSWDFSLDTNNRCEGKCGRLYDWNAAIKSCPTGWHLPSYSEWALLISNMGTQTAGQKMRTKSYRECYKGVVGLDIYGFSAVEAGAYKNDENNKKTYYDSYSTYFWTSTYVRDSRPNDLKYVVTMNCASKQTEIYGEKQDAGFSVRCLKNSE